MKKFIVIFLIIYLGLPITTASALNEISVLGILPNPAGDDTRGEFILLKNTSGQTIETTFSLESAEARQTVQIAPYSFLAVSKNTRLLLDTQWPGELLPLSITLKNSPEALIVNGTSYHYIITTEGTVTYFHCFSNLGTTTSITLFLDILPQLLTECPQPPPETAIPTAIPSPIPSIIVELTPTPIASLQPTNAPQIPLPTVQVKGVSTASKFSLGNYSKPSELAKTEEEVVQKIFAESLPEYLPPKEEETYEEKLLFAGTVITGITATSWLFLFRWPKFLDLLQKLDYYLKILQF